MRDTKDGRRAERVADALGLVVWQIGRLTLDGDVEGDEEARKVERDVKEKEREFKRQGKRKELVEEKELWMVWNALQFQGLGKGAVHASLAQSLSLKVRSDCSLDV